MTQRCHFGPSPPGMRKCDFKCRKRSSLCSATGKNNVASYTESEGRGFWCLSGPRALFDDGPRHSGWGTGPKSFLMLSNWDTQAPPLAPPAIIVRYPAVDLDF